MEIAGYEIDNKYLIAGAGGIGLLLLLNRGQSGGEPSAVAATLQPADGLSWGDIIGERDSGALKGGSGDTGSSGPPGAPGPVGPAGPAGSSGSGDSGGSSDDSDGGSGGATRCRRPRDCAHGEECRNGKCRPVRDDSGGSGGNRPDRDRPDRDRPDRDRPGSGNGGKDRNRNDRPKMPDRNRRDRDPRGDGPKDRQRRNDGDNRVNRNDPPEVNQPGSDRNRNRDRDQKEKNRGDQGGRFRINARGGRERDKGKNANANADGGRANVGNVNGNANGKVDVSGGKANANASGGNNNNKGKRKGGEAESVFSPDTGRLDGRGGTASGDVRQNISPGGRIGGFLPMQQPIATVGETAKIQPGETLKGLSRRVYGAEKFWPKIVRLNNDYDFQRGYIPAGTTFRIG